MDFTFLFIIILMLLALKSGLDLIAVGLLVILLFTSKNKYLLVATVIGGALVALVSFTGLRTSLTDPVTLSVLAGLFIILLLLARQDSDNPQPAGYMPGMMG
ncbi:MAG: hypothetical protein Q8P02_02705 [Candidatus Micrarchaeota archaeon]|nr:hypothetical protein [Candidatus Micrarchaeota archaeon]